jgi:GMP synthase (glutamine-hydrolysing)
MADNICIVDFGSQTTHLIGRRLRDMGIRVDIVDPEKAMGLIRKGKPKGIILSGGPASVYEKGAPTVNKKIYSLNIPILGICYGWQLTAYLLNGKVLKGYREYGPTNLEIESSEPLFHGVDSYSVVWMSHGDSVMELPAGFVQLARTDNIRYAAAANNDRKIYGIQFHPEVEHTKFGLEVLKNFVERICNLKVKKKNINTYSLIRKIRKEVGCSKVVCAVSGGVDSTVAATLIAKAIGSDLYPVYVESGLMRPGTKERVIRLFEKQLKVRPIIVEAKKIFLKALKGKTDPEEKRKVIGGLYVKLFEKEAKKLKGVKYLAQGTIYSDVIESKGSKNASKIKSHHNVGGLPKNMDLKLLEPLRYFYKDEVRKIGRQLKLLDGIINEQVFPGPGYAIRIIGEVTKERLQQIYKADSIVIEELKKAGVYNNVYMSFPIMTGAKSTAVKGDGRVFMEVIALRIIESKDVMTTVWSRLPYDLMQKLSSRIVNEVPFVSRVVYDITTKPPATMEWE